MDGPVGMPSEVRSLKLNLDLLFRNSCEVGTKDYLKGRQKSRLAAYQQLHTTYSDMLIYVRALYNN